MDRVEEPHRHRLRGGREMIFLADNSGQAQRCEVVCTTMKNMRTQEGVMMGGTRWGNAGVDGRYTYRTYLYKRRISASLCPTFCSVFIPCLYSHYILEFVFVLEDTTFPYINSVSSKVRVRSLYRCRCIIHSLISHVRNLRIVLANLSIV